MEAIVSQWQKKGIFNDNSIRMSTRPLPPEKPKNQERRKGQVAEDLGSGFAKKAPAKKNIVGTGAKAKPQVMSATLRDFTDSEDEMDCLSQSGAPSASNTNKAASKNEGIIGPDGKHHAFHPNFTDKKADVLKSLKFKKNKPSPDGSPLSSQQSDAFSSQSPALKENVNSGPSSGASSKPHRGESQTASSHLTPRPARDKPPSPSRKQVPKRQPKQAHDQIVSENTRPKPRPKGRVASTQLQPQPFPTPGSPARRNTVSGTGRSSQRDGPPRHAKNGSLSGETKQAAKADLTPASFPTLSPVSSALVPAAFPELIPLGRGQKGHSKKISASLHENETPTPTEPENQKKVPSDFPFLPPLSSQASGNRKRVNANSSTCVVSSEDEDDKGTSGVVAEAMITPQPFPMSTQVLGSIGSPSRSPMAGPSGLGKRTPSRSVESEREKKKKKDGDTMLTSLDDYHYEEEEDTFYISPTTDPRTLCPYCDTPLPTSPTPLLTRLLASTATKSYKDPRPANPLGRKAPFAVFIAVCQRHRFESQLLPEAELKGWPKSIEWTELEGRIGRMKEDLRALIDDPWLDPDRETDDVFFVDEDEGPKMKCLFWREVMKEVKKKGSRAVAGVQGQFASFEKARPGYYGERGSVIIQQTLYNIFPPISMDPNLVAPLTPNEFIQRILVPEVGVRLIMEDKHLSDDHGMENAVQILRDSASYGIAMFPEDNSEGGAEGGGNNADGDGDELGVADLIVMERARKRRKELQEEDEREEEELRKLGLIEKQQKSVSKKGKERSKAGKAKAVEPPPAPRPRPRPVGKPVSSSSITTDVLDAPSESSRLSPDVGTDVETDYSRGHSPMSTLPPPSSLTADDFEMKPSTGMTAQRQRITRSISRSQSADVNLCSSSDESSHSKLSQTRSRAKAAQTPKRGGGRGNRQVTAVEPHPRRPISRCSRDDENETDVEMEDTPMPVNRTRGPRSSPNPGPSGKVYPLMMAQARKRGTDAGGLKKTAPAEWSTSMRDGLQSPTPSPVGTSSSSETFSWLLSDPSQSSIA